MVTRERRLDRSRRQARRGLALIGEEFRQVRIGAGLTQQQVGVAIGISSSEVSRIELGRATRVPFETLVALGGALGLDIPLRAYPSGEPLRDAGQLALLSKMRAVLHPDLTWRTEVPIDLPGDRRAWDAVIGGRGWSVALDAESRLHDVQACTRRVALKGRDDRRQVVILLVADTRHNRQALRLAAADLAQQFPLGGRAIVDALAGGERPVGSGIVRL